MELNQRIKTILEYSKMNLSRLSREMGFKTPQALREILSGRTKTLSDNARDKILAYYPMINNEWLCFGTGEMFKEPNAKDNFQVGENIAIGSNSHVNDTTSKNLEMALQAIATQQKLTERAQEMQMKSQEQIDRLIQIIERR